MSEETTIDSLNIELESNLRIQARKRPISQKPLVFKTEVKPNLKLIDSEKTSYDVELKYLQSFSNIINNKEYKYIRLQNWEFELKYENKKCIRITLVSDYVVFFANKTNKKEIADCTFRISVADEPGISSLNQKTQRYLNRIGKRYISNASENLAPEFYALISFVPRPVQVILNDKPLRTQPELVYENEPLQFLTTDGKKMLEKLANFISVEEINSFIIDQELSAVAQKKIRKIIFPEGETNPRKARALGKV